MTVWRPPARATTVPTCRMRWLDLTEVVAGFQSTAAAASAVSAGHGKRLMDDIRSEAAGLQAE